MPKLRQVKLHEYTFDGGLESFLEGIFEVTGFFPAAAEKRGNVVKIAFAEELPESSLRALEEKIRQAHPEYRFRGKAMKYVDVDGGGLF